MGTAVLKIHRMTNQHPDFYATMGPFLSRREIVAENGAPIWDDDGKEWFVARRGRKVVGFAALKTAGGKAHLVSAYVFPDHRKSGVYSALLAARIAAAAGVPLRAVATASAVPGLLNAGFVLLSKRGRFSVMERMP